MKKFDHWTYRCIYGCHYLMSMKDNTIMAISPMVGKLFGMAESKNSFEEAVKEWAEELNIKDVQISPVLEQFTNKGVLYHE